ncbi:MAG: hypothetical protein KDC44_01685 [Phaeodactylibacter sp.]|nr:hypothetical protein [Phaeodactylibacter sp.]
METFAVIFLGLLGVYLLIGLGFSVWFYAGGMRKIDTDTQGASLVFKLIIFPGVVAFWPALWRKWQGHSK